jgi:hypothetical protein
MTKATETQGAQSYLLAIRGTRAAPDDETSRKIHNETAGAEAGVAAARALGDLSHKVFVPAKGAPGSKPGELLILDVWNNLDGLNQFIANPQVQKGGGLMFGSRDPVVFAPANDLFSFHLPTPMGQQARCVGTIRGLVKSREEARTVLNASIAKGINAARKLGLVSHDMYYRVGAPGQPESLELFGVDFWYDGKGMAEYYQAEPETFNRAFAAPPAAGVWEQPAGTWVEW